MENIPNLQDRPYQPMVVEKALSIKDPVMSIQAGAGSGKTLITKMLTEAFSKGRIVITTPRINLTHQTRKYDKSWGIRQGSVSYGANKRVVVWNYQTLLNEVDVNKNFFKDKEICIIDEAHMLAGSKHPRKSMYGLVEAGLKYRTRFIGMSATLYNANNLPFNVWKNATELMPTEWIPPMRLIEAGFLVPLLIKKTGSVNRELLKMGVDDYTEKSKGEAVDASGVDIVQGLVDHAVGATIISSSSISHARGLYKDMKSRGYSCGLYVTGEHGDNKALQKFEDGEIEYIFTVDKISVGVSINRATTFALASPVGSFAVLVQKCWRVGRLCPEINKKYGLILDFFGSVEALGHPALPPAKGEEIEKTPSIYCKECQSNKPLKVVNIEVCYEENIQITQKICPACGNETTHRKQLDVIDCQSCHYYYPIQNIYSKNGNAVCDCTKCKHTNIISPLQLPELVVHVENRDEAIMNVTALAITKGVNMDIVAKFANFATYEQLSYLLDVLGDFKGIYSKNALDIVMNKITNFEITDPLDKEINRLTGRFNRDIVEYIRIQDDEVQKAILKQIPRWNAKGYKIEDTKRYKSLIKRIITKSSKK